MRPKFVLLAAAAVLLAMAGLLRQLIPFPEPAIGGHWTLIRDDGKIVTDRDFRGRYQLLYFGYTSCPDICPTTLATISASLHLLGRDADRLQPLFITIDPAHDTPTVVRNYVRNFSIDFIGLTGSQDQIETIEHEFQISVSKPDGAASIDHTAVLILVSPTGQYLAPFAADEDASELAHQLASHIGGAPPLNQAGGGAPRPA